jgi:hypothetical protein
MDRDARMDQRTPAARKEATWSAIAMCTYLAPARIASDDSRERILVEAAQARLLASTRAAPRSPAGVGCVATTAQRQEVFMRRIVSMLPVGRRRDRTTTIDAASESVIVPINQTVQL